MDQRGYPVDPTEHVTASAVPATRLKAWGALATRAKAIALVPSQNAPAAA